MTGLVLDARLSAVLTAVLVLGWAASIAVVVLRFRRIAFVPWIVLLLVAIFGGPLAFAAGVVAWLVGRPRSCPGPDPGDDDLLTMTAERRRTRVPRHNRRERR